MGTYSCLQTKSIKPCAKERVYVYNMSEEIWNLHNKEEHQKHAHIPTLEQLTVCIAHMQNKQKWLECIYQDLHEQNNTLSVQMLHQQKPLRDWQQQLHLLQKSVQEKDSHVTTETYDMCSEADWQHTSADKQAWTDHSEHTHTARTTLKSGTKYTKREQCITTAMQADHIAKHQKQHTQQQRKEAKKKV